MNKTELFRNTIRVSKGEDYKIRPVDKVLLDKIPVQRFVPLLYRYTKLESKTYSVSDMLRKYSNGNITFGDNFYGNIEKTYGNIKILPYTPIFKDAWKWSLKWKDGWILEEDVIFENASCWVLLYKEELVGLETLLSHEKKCRRLSAGNPKKIEEFYTATFFFMRFCFEELGFEEVYRISPKGKKNPYRYGRDISTTMFAKTAEEKEDYTKFIYIHEAIERSEKEVKELI